jgi:GT2 family glycosyltransferase
MHAFNAVVPMLGDLQQGAARPSNTVANSPAQACTYIVILNWNGWRDTIECLQSVLGLQAARFRVVVCDNGSTDGSLEALTAWADGKLSVSPQGPEALRALAQIPGQAVGYTLLNRNQAETHTHGPAEQLVLIDNEENLGFAAGNNIGLRYALAQPDMAHVWLLNNDTVVEPDALVRMLARLKSAPEAGICGALLKFFDDPRMIQAVGGCRFNYLTGTASATLGRYLPDTHVIDVENFEAQMDYVSGASMLLTRVFLATIGLMEERYFLYYEEIDWAVRARGRFTQVIAADAVVYHKEGSTAGSASLQRPSSLQSDFYLFRSKLAFMRLHCPWMLPICMVSTLAQAANRLRRGRFASAWLITRVLFGKRQRQTKTI